MITTRQLRRRVNAAGFVVGILLWFVSAIMLVWGEPPLQLTWTMIGLLGILLTLTSTCFGVALGIRRLIRRATSQRHRA